MRKTISRFLLACFFVSLSQPALAEDDEVSIVGGLNYNFKRTQFDVAGKGFKPEYTTVEWSIIAAYQSFYVKAGFDQSIKDHAQINNTANGGGGVDNGGVIFSREDTNITFGYSVLDNVSLFLGYTRGETTGVLPGEMNINIGAPTTIDFRTTTISFEQQGPYIGASYSYYLEDSGSFNFSLAYADLDGNVSIRETGTRIEPVADAGTITTYNNKINGESTGISYGVTWTDQFSEAMLYSISLKSVRYEFKEPGLGTNDFDFDDVYNVFSIGFSKFF